MLAYFFPSDAVYLQDKAEEASLYPFWGLYLFSPRLRGRVGDWPLVLARLVLEQVQHEGTREERRGATAWPPGGIESTHAGAVCSTTHLGPSRRLCLLGMAARVAYGSSLLLLSGCESRSSSARWPAQIARIGYLGHDAGPAGNRTSARSSKGYTSSGWLRDATSPWSTDSRRAGWSDSRSSRLSWSGARLM